MTNPTAQWYRHRAQQLLNGGFIEQAAYCAGVADMFDTAALALESPTGWPTAAQLGAEVINGMVECSECGGWTKQRDECEKCGLALLPF